MKKVYSQKGFSLIELMIVVIIIAILSAIAYPAYTSYVLKSYRAQAKADLVEYAAMAERIHTVNNSYANYKLTDEQGVSPRDSGAKARYDITLKAEAKEFTLTATPKSTQTKDVCGTLTINQAGVKTVSGGSLTDCW